VKDGTCSTRSMAGTDEEDNQFIIAVSVLRINLIPDQIIVLACMFGRHYHRTVIRSFLPGSFDGSLSSVAAFLSSRFSRSAGKPVHRGVLYAQVLPLLSTRSGRLTAGGVDSEHRFRQSALVGHRSQVEPVDVSGRVNWRFHVTDFRSDHMVRSAEEAWGRSGCSRQVNEEVLDQDGKAEYILLRKKVEGEGRQDRGEVCRVQLLHVEETADIEQVCDGADRDKRPILARVVLHTSTERDDRRVLSRGYGQVNTSKRDTDVANWAALELLAGGEDVVQVVRKRRSGGAEHKSERRERCEHVVGTGVTDKTQECRVGLLRTSQADVRSQWNECLSADVKCGTRGDGRADVL